MDTTALRAAYEKLFDAAATPGLGAAADGGWNADQVLAHVLSVDAAVAAVALGVVSGARPAFDNRVALDPANLARIIAGHAGRADLARHVRSQAAILCDIAGSLDEQAASVQVPALLMSGDALVLDQPIPLAALIDGLAADHVPVHTRQILALKG
ncbi:hypothetical protein OHS18_18600 [Amycolatopsis sp. NBC_00355]|uniref:hypothetical protein n=1 Tax=Amycolatopsis sp. NBC_00355 TaxID=2975957 RepID=UPI002E272F37